MVKPDIIYRTLTLIFAVLLIGCSNDDTKSSPFPEGNDGESVLVEFSVPMKSFGVSVSSREESSSDVSNNQEGWLSNLYLIVIKEEDEDGKRVNSFNVHELDTSGYDPQVGEKKPSNFYVNLYPGTYRFYLLANFDRYLNRFTHITNIVNETELQTVVLNFDSSMPLMPAHLPMACYPEGFFVDDLSSEGAAKLIEGNKIQIKQHEDRETGRKVVIGANLEFLCSKVRYTILYDNTVGGFSEQFGNNSIRFVVNQTTDRPKALNIRSKTKFYPNAELSGDQYSIAYLKGYWNVEISRYHFPDNPDYPSSVNDALIPWNDLANLSEWKKAHQRAWQGVVFLPENLDDDTYTELQFPYVLEKYKGEDGTYQDAVITPGQELKCKTLSLFGGTEYQHYYGDAYGPEYSTDKKEEGYSTGLKRGYFYDVVAKVVNIDEGNLEMFIQVMVESQPWIHHGDREETL